MQSEQSHPLHFEHLSEYLRYVRQGKKMSLTDVMRASSVDGQVSGVSLSLLSKIECGRVADPRFSTMLRLARAYGVSLSEIALFF